MHRNVRRLGRDADEVLEARGVDRRVEVAVRQAIGGEQVEDLIAERERGRDAPGRHAAVCAEAEREDEQRRGAEADRPPRGRNEARSDDEHRGEADRVARRGPERDERDAGEEAHRGEGVVAQRARRIATETARGDREHAARGGRERDEETQRRRDRRIAELVGPVLGERAPVRERERETEERVRQGDHGA